jgi:hypothetical protein
LCHVKLILKKIFSPVFSESPKKKKKSRKRKRRDSSSSSSSSGEEEARPSLEQLRKKRLEREQGERARAALLLARLSGKPVPGEKPSQPPPVTQKYNSQFNPHIAKQNFK